MREKIVPAVFLMLVLLIGFPSWVKNNAGWWADGLIKDADFVSGIQYLISNGIMKV